MKQLNNKVVLAGALVVFFMLVGGGCKVLTPDTEKDSFKESGGNGKVISQQTITLHDLKLTIPSKYSLGKITSDDVDIKVGPKTEDVVNLNVQPENMGIYEKDDKGKLDKFNLTNGGEIYQSDCGGGIECDVIKLGNKLFLLGWDGNWSKTFTHADIWSILKTAELVEK